MGRKVVKALKRKDDGISHACVDFLCALMQPMHDNFDLRQEQTNKRSLLSSRSFLEGLLEPLKTHVVRRSCENHVLLHNCHVNIMCLNSDRHVACLHCLATRDWCSGNQCNTGLLYFCHVPTIQVIKSCTGLLSKFPFQSGSIPIPV